MITGVDTNILFDILFRNSPHGSESLARLTEAAEEGTLIICETVFAELASRFHDSLQLDEFLTSVSVMYQSSSRAALLRAGDAWFEYARRRPRRFACPTCGTSADLICQRCGTVFRPKQHLIADFMIGAHALVHASRLLTRDQGYFRTYFPELVLF